MGGSALGAEGVRKLVRDKGYNTVRPFIMPGNYNNESYRSRRTVSWSRRAEGKGVRGQAERQAAWGCIPVIPSTV